MTTTDFQNNEALVKHWNTEFKSETFKEVYSAMDESSPIYEDIPEISGEDAAAKHWFTRGYAFYHKRLKELSQLKPRPMPLKPSYKKPEIKNAA